MKSIINGNSVPSPGQGSMWPHSGTRPEGGAHWRVSAQPKEPFPWAHYLWKGAKLSSAMCEGGGRGRGPGQSDPLLQSWLSGWHLWHHSGGEGWGWEVPARNIKSHLNAQLWLWNQFPSEETPLLWNQFPVLICLLLKRGLKCPS